MREEKKWSFFKIIYCERLFYEALLVFLRQI